MVSVDVTGQPWNHTRWARPRTPHPFLTALTRNYALEEPPLAGDEPVNDLATVIYRRLVGPAALLSQHQEGSMRTMSCRARSSISRLATCTG
jgi:hypothetical protein